jgi:hypothetical protein
MAEKTSTVELQNPVLRLGSETSNLPFEVVVRNCPTGVTEVLDEGGHAFAYLVRLPPVEDDLDALVERILMNDADDFRQTLAGPKTGRTLAEIIANIERHNGNGGGNECRSP